MPETPSNISDFALYGKVSASSYIQMYIRTEYVRFSPAYCKKETQNKKHLNSYNSEIS